MPNFRDYPPQFARYNSQYAGRKEVQGWQLWDTHAYLTGVTAALRFFAVMGLTPDISNMEAAGHIPAPKAFLVRAINFFVKDVPESVATAAAGAVQPGAIDNLALLVNTGVLSFTIGHKNYGQYPLWMLPAGGGAFGGIAAENVLIAGAAVDWGNSGFPDSRNAYTLTKPIFIMPDINFFVDLLWPAGFVAPIRNLMLTVLFDGEIVRPVQ